VESAAGTSVILPPCKATSFAVPGCPRLELHDASVQSEPRPRKQTQNRSPHRSSSCYTRPPVPECLRWGRFETGRTPRKPHARRNHPVPSKTTRPSNHGMTRVLKSRSGMSPARKRSHPLTPRRVHRFSVKRMRWAQPYLPPRSTARSEAEAPWQTVPPPVQLPTASAKCLRA